MQAIAQAVHFKAAVECRAVVFKKTVGPATHGTTAVKCNVWLFKGNASKLSVLQHPTQCLSERSCL